MREATTALVTAATYSTNAELYKQLAVGEAWLCTVLMTHTQLDFAYENLVSCGPWVRERLRTCAFNCRPDRWP